MVQIEAEIIGIAGSYVENRQQKYEPFFSKDWAKLFLLLVFKTFGHIPPRKASGRAIVSSSLRCTPGDTPLYPLCIREQRFYG
jgi:hypothetical protein